jgi:hypothetical protein
MSARARQTHRAPSWRIPREPFDVAADEALIALRRSASSLEDDMETALDEAVDARSTAERYWDAARDRPPVVARLHRLHAMLELDALEASRDIARGAAISLATLLREADGLTTPPSHLAGELTAARAEGRALERALRRARVTLSRTLEQGDQHFDRGDDELIPEPSTTPRLEERSDRPGRGFPPLVVETNAPHERLRDALDEDEVWRADVAVGNAAEVVEGFSRSATAAMQTAADYRQRRARFPTSAALAQEAGCVRHQRNEAAASLRAFDTHISTLTSLIAQTERRPPRGRTDTHAWQLDLAEARMRWAELQARRDAIGQVHDQAVQDFRFARSAVAGENQLRMREVTPLTSPEVRSAQRAQRRADVFQTGASAYAPPPQRRDGARRR